MEKDNGVEEILNDYIRDLADRATAYLNCDTITVAKIQYALEQWAHGEEYHIPTTEKSEQDEVPPNTTITSEDVFKHLEQNTKRLNFTVTKGHNYGEPEVNNMIIGKSGIVKKWKP